MKIKVICSGCGLTFDCIKEGNDCTPKSCPHCKGEIVKINQRSGSNTKTAWIKGLKE